MLLWQPANSMHCTLQLTVSAWLLHGCFVLLCAASVTALCISVPSCYHRNASWLSKEPLPSVMTCACSGQVSALTLAAIRALAASVAGMTAVLPAQPEQA